MPHHYPRVAAFLEKLPQALASIHITKKSTESYVLDVYHQRNDACGVHDSNFLDDLVYFSEPFLTKSTDCNP